VLADIASLVDWQLDGGEDREYWRSYNALKHPATCYCGKPADGHGHGGDHRSSPGAIAIDGHIGRAFTVDLSAGVYTTLWLGNLELPLSEPITLTEPGSLVVTMSEPAASPDGEVFYVRVGRPRRTGRVHV
jgi:hypothetical protein